MSDLSINSINNLVEFNKMASVNLPAGQNNAITNFEDVLQKQNELVMQNFDNTHFLQGGVNFDTKLFEQTPAVPKLSDTQNTANNLGQAFLNGLNSVNAQQVKSQNMTMALAAGEDVDIHDAMIESQKASLSLSMAVQMRNKLLSAYNEIYSMRF